MNILANIVSKNLTVFILVLLNIAVKGFYLNYSPIDGDEPFSIFHAQLNVTSIIEELKTGNNPPLYEIILSFWVKVFGVSELSVRTPSLIFSATTTFLLYKLLAKYFNTRIALITSLLFIFSNINILAAQEARVYSLFVLLTVASYYQFVSLYSSNKKNLHLLLISAVNIVLIYSHYFGFFVIFTQFVLLLLINDLRKNALKYYLYSLIILSVFYTPNLFILWNRFLDSSSNGTWISPPSGVESIYNMLWEFSNKPITTVVSLLIIVTALFLFIYRKNKTSSVYYKIAIGWFAIPFSVMFISSYWVPMFFPKYLIFVSIGYYIVLAISIESIFKNNLYKKLLGSSIIILFAATASFKKESPFNFRDITTIFNNEITNTHDVIISPKHYALHFAYYYDKSLFNNGNKNNGIESVIKKLNALNIFPINVLKEYNTSNKNRPVLYLNIHSEFLYPNNETLKYLNTKFELVKSIPFKDGYYLNTYLPKNLK
jgi:mannosyltransferase